MRTDMCVCRHVHGHVYGHGYMGTDMRADMCVEMRIDTMSPMRTAAKIIIK